MLFPFVLFAPGKASREGYLSGIKRLHKTYLAVEGLFFIRLHDRLFRDEAPALIAPSSLCRHQLNANFEIFDPDVDGVLGG